MIDTEEGKFPWAEAWRFGLDWPAYPDEHDHGFLGAHVQVVRVCQIRGRRILTIETQHAQVEISISPTGKVLTVCPVRGTVKVR